MLINFNMWWYYFTIYNKSLTAIFLFPSLFQNSLSLQLKFVYKIYNDLDKIISIGINMYRKLLYTQHKNFLENRHEHVLVHDVQWLKNVTLININET